MLHMQNNTANVSKALSLSATLDHGTDWTLRSADESMRIMRTESSGKTSASMPHIPINTSARSYDENMGLPYSATSNFPSFVGKGADTSTYDAWLARTWSSLSLICSSELPYHGYEVLWAVLLIGTILSFKLATLAPTFDLRESPQSKQYYKRCYTRRPSSGPVSLGQAQAHSELNPRGWANYKQPNQCWTEKTLASKS